MAKLGDFIAFNAVIELLKDNKQEDFMKKFIKSVNIKRTYKKEDMKNYVKEIYKTFSAEEISKKIAELLKPKNSTAEVIIIYQSIKDLHSSCLNHTGDWYFTGDYPTPGGIKVLNNAFINYIEGKIKEPINLNFLLFITLLNKDIP